MLVRVGVALLAFPTPSFGVGASVDAKHGAVAFVDQLGMALLRYRRP
ncbi:MAG TPA: hypothetical protein VK306_16215 [Acidimicrobiales bacterium]|nr:hypothetical protein [Acidimicrobiales bacterium]